MLSEKELTTKYLTVNMGPQHPATHGVLRLVLDLDGEVVVRCTPHIGYLHRGMEKQSEHMTYPAAMTLMSRLDYCASVANETGFCLAAEKLLGVEVPERAKYIRTMTAEMARICSHIIWIAAHAIDIGAMTVFLYSMRDREELLDLFEMLCGARLLHIYPRIGGVRCDVSKEFLDRLWRFTERFPKLIEEYETLIDQNRIWFQRTKGIGVLSAETAINLGLTGPSLRGSGIAYDIRKIAPYDAYDRVEFDVPVGKNCDVYDRYRCRMEEFRQSNRIIRQCIQNLPDGLVLNPDAPGLDMQAGLLKKAAVVPVGDTEAAPAPAVQQAQVFEEIYCATEVPKGELGYYMISDGTGRPYRMRIRTPSFVHIAALQHICVGALVADVIALIGTIDIVLGECDR